MIVMCSIYGGNETFVQNFCLWNPQTPNGKKVRGGWLTLPECLHNLYSLPKDAEMIK
jgi:hypothetical protein